ncbi:hypothetical protein GPJ56_005400 [Histomonas meleagridis]|uniref:uncharacterized protein n=1 Tax=Histomonas meleagridis TaxID=135588 RepID=UPI0035596E07|nr:hypothetical protein GPJ56_005400 [Histomonas meleagridis]KAH0801830.1 hypothetical protein GO595_005397 [Histomonas meleagridis]
MEPESNPLVDGLDEIFMFKFIYAKTDPQYKYQIPSLPIPDISDHSPFKNISPPISEVPQILNKIYQLHLQTKVPLYIDNSDNQFVYNFRQLSPYFHMIVPFSLVVVTSKYTRLNMESILQVFSPEQFYLVLHILYHFQALVKCTDIYSRAIVRKKLWEKLLDILTPIQMISKNHFPLIDVAKNEKKKTKIIVNFRSKDVVYVSPRENLDYVEKYKFVELKANTNQIIFDAKNGEKLQFSPQSFELWKDYLINATTPNNRTTECVSSSFLSIPPNTSINPTIAESLSRMLLNYDPNFISGLLKMIFDYPEAKQLAYSLYDIYSYYGQRIRFFKMISNFEVQRLLGTPNEIYRQNNVFTQITVEYLREQLGQFVKLGLVPIFHSVGEMPTFRYDDPDDNDVQIIDQLFQMFFSRIDAALYLIPQGVRQILRHLRILCEMNFGSKELNHRAVIGLFMLRFLVPTLGSIDALGIPENEITDTIMRNNLQFSKAIMALSSLDLAYNGVRDRDLLNDIFIKYFPYMVSFLDSLTELTFEYPEDVTVSIEEMLQGINKFRTFFQNFSNELIQCTSALEPAPSPFLAEAVSTLYEICIFD